MRKDMAKVIVERPRKIDSYRRRGRYVDDELLPKAIGLRRHVQEAGGYKMLNENLAPLQRYLSRQVGRPWNKIYAEIAEHLKPTSTVQQHVRDHLKDFVQLHPSEDVRQYPWSRRPWFQPFYVDRRDGLLKRTDRLAWAKAFAARPSPSKAADVMPLDDNRELRRLGGLWFEVRLAPLPEPEYRAVTRSVSSHGKPPREASLRQLVTPAVHDAVTGAAVCAGPELDEPRAWEAYRKAHTRRLYAVAKRQVSRAELRRYGLTNDPAGEPS
ncbi:MAG: hypothetical protein H2041_08295 [Phenylobacterium sp.]|uniref:hypothetical protein n=1 Tax=Phenylobacterium sp. TaxID=1871053 RepID=UPI0017AD2294|nr:hypothetical protein [Phenylobacterium sp.]MBA4793650.1 hypothetical protein [Phenylobacterium sp.]